MPPILYLVRHGEAEHNINRRHHLRDPPLTPLGHDQCTTLRTTFPDQSSISLLLASPLRRTIQTAHECFSPSLAANPSLPFLLVPLAQEIAANPCDTGFPPADLAASLPTDLPAEIAARVDLSLVHDGWNSKAGDYATTFPAVEARAKALRAWLRGRPEERVVLVTHGAFLHYLIEDWADYDKAKGTGFANCEVRAYRFEEEGEGLVAMEGEAAREGYVKGGRPGWVNRNVLTDGEGEEGARL